MKRRYEQLDYPATEKRKDFFVEVFMRYDRNIRKAARMGNFPLREAIGLYKDPEVRQRIDRRIEIVAEARAAEEAKTQEAVIRKRLLDVETLDTELVKIVTVDVEKFPTLGNVKHNAIRTGYQRVGLLIDENFIPDAKDNPSSGPETESVRIFRSVRETTSILLHTMDTEGLKEAPQAPMLPEPAPRVIEATKPAVAPKKAEEACLYDF